MADLLNNDTIKNFTEKVFGAENDSAAKSDKAALSRYNDIAAKMFNTRVLSAKEMVFPAIAEFARKVSDALSVYRTLYFVSVLKIDMVYVTAILALIGIYDVLNDPLMGIAYDRTRTRWGKARPYLLFTPVPYYLTTAILYSGAVFLTNSNTNDPRKIIFVFVTLFIQETFSTIFGLPRNNMSSLMSPNPQDRITLGLVMGYAGTTGSELVFAIFMPLQDLNRWGITNISMPQIFAILGCVCACVGAMGNISMALGCRERILLQPKPAPVTKTMFYILKNKYQLRDFVASFVTNWWSSGGYSWDVVTQLEIFGGAFKSALFYSPRNILNSLSLLLVPKFQRIFKGNNRRAVITLRMWDILADVLKYFVGVPFIEKSWVVGTIFGLFSALNALNNAPGDVFEAEMGREICDYTEYMTGERPDGTIGMIPNLIRNVTAPLQAIMTIAVFKWTGYNPTIAMTPWSQNNREVYRRVYYLYTVFGMFPRFIKLIPVFFYDITGKKREDMYIALNERRALVAKERHEELSQEMEAMIEILSQEEE